MKKWTIEDSKELYNICGWGTSYFGINDKGDVYVTPCKDNTQIDLRDIMDELALRDINAPVLLRFPDILDNRIEKTASCFQKAKEEYGYKGENFVIYPIKVNQMQPVVEEIISHGKKFNLGLEAGSKPELHAVIAVQAQSDSLIICNGYKDESYIELALLAQKMGKRIFIVVEKLNELDIIEKVAKKLNVKPNIGIRIKLASSGSGKWAESGGDASKFGLTSAELLTALKKIDEMGFHDCLRLIHFHIGSQITKIRRIQTALREAAQFYISLHKMGYNVDFVDCGGGLGVDYDGTRSSSSESSVNYSIQEYVNDCVYTFVDAANKNNIEHPNLITESGRSLSAHHSVLVIDVLETASLPEMPEEFEAKETDHQLVKDLYEIWDNLNPRNMLEDWHDAEQIRDEALQLFSHGIVDLKTRAEIEAMYWSVCHEINNLAKHMKHVPEELRGSGQDSCRQVFLQLLSVPEPARQLGYRPALPYHAYPASERASYPQRYLAGHHLRQRRKDCQLRNRWSYRQCSSSSSIEEERAILSRCVPRRCLPGDSGRYAQSLRRHQCCPHLCKGRQVLHRPDIRWRDRRGGFGLRTVQSEEARPPVGAVGNQECEGRQDFAR